MPDNYENIISENRQIYDLIIGELSNCLLWRRELDEVYCHLGLCRLFKERYDSLKDKMFGAGQENMVNTDIISVRTIDDILVAELTNRGIKDDEINKKVETEVEKLRIIWRT